MSRVSAAVAVVTIVLLVSLAAATAGFSLSLNNTITVPDRQVTVEDDTFTVSEISQFSQGETLTVETTGPDGESYRVYIYRTKDGGFSIWEQTYVSASNDGTVTFDTNGYPAGSYVAVIDHDGTFYDPHPFVVAGYDLSLSMNEENPEPGDTVSLTVTATPTASSGDPASVEVVVTHDDRVTRHTATPDGDGYTATIPVDEAGEYRVYAVAHSNEKAPEGGTEVIALTQPTTLSVSSQTTTDTPPAGGGSTTETTATTTTTTTTGSTSTTIPTSTTETTRSTSQQPSPSTSTTSGTDATRTTTEASGTTDDVVTPNPSTSTTRGETPNRAPWLLGAVLAVCLGVLRLRARR